MLDSAKRRFLIQRMNDLGGKHGASKMAPRSIFGRVALLLLGVGFRRSIGRRGAPRRRTRSRHTNLFVMHTISSCHLLLIKDILNSADSPRPEELFFFVRVNTVGNCFVSLL